MAKRVQTPLETDRIKELQAGDFVLLEGVVYTARDAAHARLTDLLERGEDLPFNPDGAVIYYVGPCPAKPGQVIGPAGPTTSARMDGFVPKLLKAGIRGMIGKGDRAEKVIESIREYQSVYFVAVGGAGAYLAKHISRSRVIAFDDLGPEAIHELHLMDFPVFVAIDATGRNLYDELKKTGR